MALASGNFQALLEPKLRKVFFESYREKPEEYSKVFRVNSSRKAKETDQHVGALGVWEKKDPQGSIKYESLNMGDEAVYIHEEYAKGIQVERKLADDELYDVINKLPKSLGRGGRVLVEITSAQVFNDAFTVDGYDGSPLCANDHEQASTDALGDNLITDALGDEGIRVAHLHIKRQTDEAGIKIQARGDTIVVPDDLELDLLVLLGSDKLTGTNFNDISVIKGKYKPVVLSYLDDPNNWFMLDSTLHELTFFWRIRPEFKGEENFDTMVAKYRGYLRFSVGYSDWRGVVGANVT